VNEAYKYGTVIGAELADYGVNVNLAGHQSHRREPRWRTFGPGEIRFWRARSLPRTSTPFRLSMCLAHQALCFNDQESGVARPMFSSTNGVAESDLLAFEIGVKDSNVQSVMCSYN